MGISAYQGNFWSLGEFLILEEVSNHQGGIHSI